MLEKTKKTSILLVLLVFSFVFKFALMTWNVFPPGADIGLHESVIQSIFAGNNDFSMIYYHMGGGVSVTNPGYHIFTNIFATLTVANDYFVHSIIVSFFSAISVLIAFLITDKLWSKNAAYIAGFLAIFCSGDISMLCWGGYPNIIALFLIPIIFYMYLLNPKWNSIKFLIVSSLIIGALFLTHLFSAIIFVIITISTAIIRIFIFKKNRKLILNTIIWILPILIGALIVSPYLIKTVPIYFGAEGTITGSVSEVNQILLETRSVPLEVLFVSFIPVILFFVFSKYYNAKYFTSTGILFSFWVLIPALLTQSHSIGIYLDFIRYQYFLYFPIIVCIALSIEKGSKLLTNKILLIFQSFQDKNLKLLKIDWNIIFGITLFSLLISSIFFLPLFSTINNSFEEAKYYQTMTPSGYDAIQWAKSYTNNNSIFVADAEYGWWFSGFSHRPTLSAVSPQFLILSHELESADVARNILNKEYFIDNGILQLNYFTDDSEEKNLKFTTNFNKSANPYQFFSVNHEDITLTYRYNGTSRHVNFDSMKITNIQLKNSSNLVDFELVLENQILIFKEKITIFFGTKFAKLSMEIKSKNQDVSLNWLHFPFKSEGIQIQSNNSIGFIDSSVNSLNQIILSNETLGSGVILENNPNSFELVYSIDGKNCSEFEIFVGSSLIQNFNVMDETIYNIMEENSEHFLNIIKNSKITFFDYQNAIKTWNISYIISSNFQTTNKLRNNDCFNLIYKNKEIAIFKVN